MMKAENKKYPSVEELMKLIAKLNGWTDKSSSVVIGYMPATIREWGSNESMTDYSRWGWVASSTICGMDKLTAHGEGTTLEQALFNLAKAIPDKIQEVGQSYNRRYLSSYQDLEQFVAEQRKNQ